MIFALAVGVLLTACSGATPSTIEASPNNSDTPAEVLGDAVTSTPTQSQDEPETGATATPIPEPTPTPQPVEPGTIVVGVASLTGAPTDDLIDALGQALETAVFEAPVEVRGVSLPSTVQSVSDIGSGTSDLLVVWEPVGNTTNVYLLAPTLRPALAQVGEPVALWPVIAPGLYPIRIVDQVDVAAEMAVGFLELLEDQPDEAFGRFQFLQGALFDMSQGLEEYNTPVLLFGQAQVEAVNSSGIDALQTYSRILRDAPAFEAAEIGRGNVYLQAGDGQAALADYGNADPGALDQAELLYNRALAERLVGDLDAALADADRLTQLTPNLPHGVNLRGVIYYDRGDYREAVADFNLAAEIDPDTPVPVFNQALTLDAMGDHGQALVIFDALIESHPDDPTFYYYFGRAFESAGELEQAEEAYSRALELDQNYFEAYLHRGEVEVSLSHFEAAIEDAQQALDLNISSGPAYRVLGDARLGIDDYSGAQAAYTSAIDNDVRDPAVYAGRAYALHRQGLRTAALADYGHARELGINDPLMLMRFGFALYDSGQYEESLALFSEAIAAGLETAGGYAGYSLALDANIRREDAEEAYQQALNLDDSYSQVSFLEEQPLWSDQAITRAVTILRRLSIDPYQQDGDSS